MDKKKYDKFKFQYLVSKKTEKQFSSNIFLKNLIEIYEKHKKNNYDN